MASDSAWVICMLPGCLRALCPPEPEPPVFELSSMITLWNASGFDEIIYNRVFFTW